MNPHRDLIRWVSFSPDGEMVATASFDGNLQLRNSHTAELTVTLAGHEPKAVWGSFARSSNLLASGGQDRTVRLWNSHSGELVREFQGHRAETSAGAISPDGNVIVSGRPDGALFFWNANTGEPTRNLKHPASVHWIAMAHDGQTAAVADIHGLRSCSGGGRRLFDTTNMVDGSTPSEPNQTAFLVAR
jgi:WD40 repeat protein